MIVKRSFDNPGHDDFIVVSSKTQLGGYEVLKHKDDSVTVILPPSFHSVLFLTTASSPDTFFSESFATI
jgi:hypothetical protein